MYLSSPIAGHELILRGCISSKGLDRKKLANQMGIENLANNQVWETILQTQIKQETKKKKIYIYIYIYIHTS